MLFNPRAKAAWDFFIYIKNTILKDSKVKYFTSKIFRDNGTWKPFRDLIQAIKDSHPDIDGVYYEDDPYYPNGYLWQNGKMVGKNRIITIETKYGDIKGSVRCFGAGTVEDPLESYDITLQIFV